LTQVTCASKRVSVTASVFPTGVAYSVHPAQRNLFTILGKGRLRGPFFF